MGNEPKDLDMHNDFGRSLAVRSGHMDHGSVTPDRFAQLVRKALFTREMIC